MLTIASGGYWRNGTGAHLGAPVSYCRIWLRGVDLNHRPLGYEPKRSILSPVESIALPRTKPAKPRQRVPILHASCT